MTMPPDVVTVQVEDETDVVEVGYAPAMPVVSLTGGDLGGTAGVPTVVSTHLSSPLPLTQGGTGASTSAAALAALGGVSLASLGGAPVDWFNVKSAAYGAAGNGTTDDTAAIQAAVTAAGAAGGGVVYIPHGTYKVSSTITCSASGVAIIGTPTEQVGTGTMIVPTTLAFTVFAFTGNWYMLKDFCVKWNTLTGASGGGATGPIGISLLGANNTQMQNVQLIHAYNGILVEAGGCTFTGVQVELAAVADTGRYGICISGPSGNPNSFNAYTCGVTCDTSYTGDGWVMANGFSSIMLYNCYAAACRYAFWSAQNAGPTTSGGTTPSGAVFDQFTCEFCDVAFRLDYGNNLMINGAQVDSMNAPNSGIQIASTWASNGLVQISGLEYGPSQGGIYIASAATVVITNAVFQSCTQNPAIEVTGAANVIVSGLWANPNGGAPAGTGTVQLDAGFTGSLNMSDFVLLNNVYGFLAAAGATGTYQLSNGKIGTCSSAPLSLGAWNTGCAIVNVSGISSTGAMSTTSRENVFGDGSDGVVLMNGTNTYSGFSSSGTNTYTLTRDVFATSLTISVGVTLFPQAFRIFCMGTVTNNGTISDIGPAATSSSGAGASSGGGSHTLQCSGTGGTGNTGAGGGGGQQTAIGIGSGGNGGTGSAGAAGSGAGGRGGSGTWLFKSPSAVLSGITWAATSQNPMVLSGGSGGGGGGGDGTNHGGGGGAGGGPITILGWFVINNGTITCPGGAGFTPATGACGGGGGGGGGIILVYSLSPWTAGTTVVTGGAAGSGVGTGTAGSAGGNGSVYNVVVQ